MPNDIRTPKPGTPAHIKEAVDNQQWQEFRLSLKGIQTPEKLRRLKNYLSQNPEESDLRRIRVDNYLKALARGGQIAPSNTDYILDLQADCLEVRR